MDVEAVYSFWHYDSIVQSRKGLCLECVVLARDISMTRASAQKITTKQLFLTLSTRFQNNTVLNAGSEIHDTVLWALLSKAYASQEMSLAWRMEFMKHRFPVLTNPLGCSLSLEVSTYCWKSSITLRILPLTASSKSVTGKLLVSAATGVLCEEDWELVPTLSSPALEPVSAAVGASALAAGLTSACSSAYMKQVSSYEEWLAHQLFLQSKQTWIMSMHMGIW